MARTFSAYARTSGHSSSRVFQSVNGVNSYINIGDAERDKAVETALRSLNADDAKQAKKLLGTAGTVQLQEINIQNIQITNGDAKITLGFRVKDCDNKVYPVTAELEYVKGPETSWRIANMKAGYDEAQQPQATFNWSKLFSGDSDDDTDDDTDSDSDSVRSGWW